MKGRRNGERNLGSSVVGSAFLRNHNVDMIQGSMVGVASAAVGTSAV